MAYQFLDRTVALPKTSGEIATRFGHDGWMMTDAERCTLVTILSERRPECAIEVGTYKGGSLGILAKFCKKVYSLDLDPALRNERGHEFPNVEFIIGNSRQTLPMLIDKIQRTNESLGFVLIDADHSEQGVRADINHLLQYKPNCPLYILLHDSFNPDCRRGMLTADWALNPHVHLVEIDFAVGRFVTAEEGNGARTMCCGFALAILLPERRTGRALIRQNDHLIYRIAYLFSVNAFRRPWNPFYSIPRHTRTNVRKVKRFLRQAILEHSPKLHAWLRNHGGKKTEVSR